MREADSTSGGTDSDTFCCCESDTESYTSDNSHAHSGPLFVPDNESSSMSNTTDCDTDTDAKVQIDQIIIMLYPKEYINIGRLTLYATKK